MKPCYYGQEVEVESTDDTEGLAFAQSIMDQPGSKLEVYGDLVVGRVFNSMPRFTMSKETAVKLGWL